ncbi:hypothetical protein SKAU_G00100820 [Synaphobranchus kaupii]|uniref:Uncharacterized protein n=1 Tax=Synaphobranchus kaupii TaxID=118154 RepID=A0A9Q1J738_SYNKA|nr:hypothetical protein SKAU_G00100820 [Synaphobranchus kaupii]
MEGDDVSVREQIFHNRVREIIICILLFICLYILSYFIITHFKKTFCVCEFVSDDSEEATVNRIALWLCTFTLSVSMGAVLLLPSPSCPNEGAALLPAQLLHAVAHGSLIHGLWNLVFLFSNLSLFFLMPFAYFFTESEGFVGSKKGLIWPLVRDGGGAAAPHPAGARHRVGGPAALLHHDTAQESLYDMWEYYLPYLYSGISLFGVLLLLLCTPFGLSRMFSITGSLLVKPRLLENVEETVSCALFEEASLSRKLTGEASCWINLNMEVVKRRVSQCAGPAHCLGDEEEGVAVAA